MLVSKLTYDAKIFAAGAMISFQNVTKIKNSDISNILVPKLTFYLNFGVITPSKQSD